MPILSSPITWHKAPQLRGTLPHPANQANLFTECLLFYLCWELSEVVKVMQALLADWKEKSCFNFIAAETINNNFFFFGQGLIVE